MADLLRSKSEESRQLRSQGLKLLEDEAPRSFWRQDFDQYRSADLTPGQHKLSKLLTAGTVSLMLSQGDSSFDLRDVMDSGKILLVDLSTIVFNVDTKDAQYLKKDLQGLVEVDDLAALEFAEAIARIGTQVVRIKTYPPLDVAADHCRDLIIAQSRARYYKPVRDVRRAVRARRERWREPLTSVSECDAASNPATGPQDDRHGDGTDGGDGETFTYDEF